MTLAALHQHISEFCVRHGIGVTERQSVPVELVSATPELTAEALADELRDAGLAPNARVREASFEQDYRVFEYTAEGDRELACVRKLADFLEPLRLRAPIILVEHASLRVFDPASAFKRLCPVCEGLLLVWRRPPTFRLSRFDRCVLCAQRVWYTDARVGGEEFAERPGEVPES